MTSDMWTGGRLVELSEKECWEVLEEHHVGRFIWCVDGRPHVVPVNFTVQDGMVWIRSTPYSHLARESRDRAVAFEVDEIDDYTHSGVSVVVEGIARPQVGEAERSSAPEVETWVEGRRPFVVEIETDQVTGRRLMPS